MQRAVDNVPGQGRLDRDLGGLDVTNLTHENLVGVLTQNTAKAIGKGQPDLLLDLDLDNAFKIVFDRILGRNNLHVD